MWGELSSECGESCLGAIFFGMSCLWVSCLWGELSCFLDEKQASL